MLLPVEKLLIAVNVIPQPGWSLQVADKVLSFVVLRLYDMVVAFVLGLQVMNMMILPLAEPVQTADNVVLPFAEAQMVFHRAVVLPFEVEEGNDEVVQMVYHKAVVLPFEVEEGNDEVLSLEGLYQRKADEFLSFEGEVLAEGSPVLQYEVKVQMLDQEEVLSFEEVCSIEIDMFLSLEKEVVGAAVLFVIGIQRGSYVILPSEEETLSVVDDMVV